MQRLQVPQKARTHHAEKRVEILAKDMRHRVFVMAMCFLQIRQVPLESLFAFKPFDLFLHRSKVRRHLKRSVVMKMNVVIRFALHQMHPLLFHRSPQITKRLVEKMRQQQQAWTLIKSLSTKISIHSPT
jgi:hypothetical protein